MTNQPSPHNRPLLFCFLFILLFMALGGCTTVKETPRQYARERHKNRQEMNELLRLNDLNERAFAYHHYCLRETEPVNEQFLVNFKIITDMLYDKCLETMNWEPEFIVEQLVERRQSIQQKLSKLYQSEGCHSAEAMTASAHYKALSQPDN